MSVSRAQRPEHHTTIDLHNEMNQTQMNMEREDQSQWSPTRRRAEWCQDFVGQKIANQTQIPKCFSNYGFRYYLEWPISTAQSLKEDRITYINKFHSYSITLEYKPDPANPLIRGMVKSVVMLTFRKKKSPDEEIKAWKLWHNKQSNKKRRILNVDTKNCNGLFCIDEISLNAVSFFWNPLKSQAKIDVAVHCLSTDFSEQKGVKGIPFHLQIDTYYDMLENRPVFHRGYCQIKVFADKGAQRKARSEERAFKRRMNATVNDKVSKQNHSPCERSEFYSMVDINKPAVLFNPAQDIDKQTSMELQEYRYDTDTSNSLSNSGSGLLDHPAPLLSQPAMSMAMQTLNFHNHFPSDTSNVCNNNTYYNSENKEVLDQNRQTADNMFLGLSNKLVPPINKQVILYVRQQHEKVYTPLYVIPPTIQGLLNAIEAKYYISASRIGNVYKITKKRITVKIDDDMLKYYSHEDTFLLEVMYSDQDEDMLEVRLTELIDH